MTHHVGVENRTIMILFLLVLVGLITPIHLTVFKYFPREIAEFLRGKTSIVQVLATDAGLYHALPTDAFYMRQALVENAVKTYRLSTPLQKRIFFQRIVEGSYPIIPTPNAKHVFISNEEPIEKTCKLIQQLQEVRLVYCP